MLSVPGRKFFFRLFFLSWCVFSISAFGSTNIASLSSVTASSQDTSTGQLAVRAVDGVVLIVLARRDVRLSVARLRTLGEIAELLTSDLRFSVEETDCLFGESFQHPLRHDVLVDLARRTRRVIRLRGGHVVADEEAVGDKL